jgi:hypothetical protein
MRVGVIDKHGAPIPLLSLIRTLTVGLRVSLSQPPTGCVRVADYNRRFEITSTPITTSEFYRFKEESKTRWPARRVRGERQQIQSQLSIP